MASFVLGLDPPDFTHPLNPLNFLDPPALPNTLDPLVSPNPLDLPDALKSLDSLDPLHFLDLRDAQDPLNSLHPDPPTLTALLWPSAQPGSESRAMASGGQLQ